MERIEYRVGPVTRFNLTRHHFDDGRGQSTTTTVGEFDSRVNALDVGLALARRDRSDRVPALRQVLLNGSSLDQPRPPTEILLPPMDGRPVKFAIVARGFEVETRAYYAYSEREAELVKTWAEAQHGCEFQVFGRSEELKLPSQFGIGASVVVDLRPPNDSDERSLAYPGIVKGLVTAVKFTESKVLYEVDYGIGRAVDVDSTLVAGVSDSSGMPADTAAAVRSVNAATTRP